jgi:hypothetical protein
VGTGSLTIDLDAAGDRVPLSRSRATNHKSQIGRAVSKASSRSDHGTSEGEGAGTPTRLDALPRCRGRPTRRPRGGTGAGAGGRGRKRPSSPWSSLLVTVAQGRKGSSRVELVGSSRPFFSCGWLRFGSVGCSRSGLWSRRRRVMGSFWAQTQWALFGSS